MTSATRPRGGPPGGPDGRGLDLLVVGGGVAGLSAAVRVAAAEPGTRVAVVSKAALDHSATWWAQGGVAAVLSDCEVERPGFVDSTESHISDTLRAGAGLCDRDAVDVLIREGPERVRELASFGAHFDRGPSGRWELAREGGHSVARVVHSGGAATGAEVERTLAAKASSLGVELVEGWFALDIIVRAGRCQGIIFLTPDGLLVDVSARHTLLATGGAGQLYPVTTNPIESTGDGIAMALRAGVAVADVEFVQFHPTALHAGSPEGPRVLLSEALRGEGALLRDLAGERFVDEMAPRDIVAASVADRIRASSAGHVWLDVSGIPNFSVHFPSLAARVREAGVDPDHEWLPVAPAAHYICGGVMADLDGATTLPGLWVAGETACSGVHGANRLASNSLLEGMVFAARAVNAILAGKNSPDPTGVLRALEDPAPADRFAIRAEKLDRNRFSELGRGLPGWSGSPAGSERHPSPVPAASSMTVYQEGAVATSIGAAAPSMTAPPRAETHPGVDLEEARRHLQKAMFDGVGVLRSADSLLEASRSIEAIQRKHPAGPFASPVGSGGQVRSDIEGLVGAAGAAPGTRDGADPGDRAASVIGGSFQSVELRNLQDLASAVIAGAIARAESRGGHRRSDYPSALDVMSCRFVQ